VAVFPIWNREVFAAVSPPADRRAARIRIIALAALFAGSVLSRAAAAGITLKAIDAAGQPVADAVIALYPLDAPMPVAAPAAPVEIEQRNLQFHPFVTVLRVGSSVVMPNREKKVEHHVYSSSASKKFELPLYKPGKAETVTFDQSGVVVLGCNIHDAMLAYVIVVDSAWFACTGADGNAVFAQLPAGRWRAEVWHPRLKDAAEGLGVAVKHAFTVSDGGPASVQAVALKLEPDRRLRRGPTIGGGSYK
jgi:plastocyanin